LEKLISLINNTNDDIKFYVKNDYYTPIESNTYTDFYNKIKHKIDSDIKDRKVHRVEDSKVIQSSLDDNMFRNVLVTGDMPITDTWIKVLKSC